MADAPLLTVEVLGRIVSETDRDAIRLMIALLPVDQLLSRELCNQGFGYYGKMLFNAVQIKAVNQTHRPKLVMITVNRLSGIAWGLIGSNEQERWDAAAAEIRGMDRLKGRLLIKSYSSF